jgi:cytochrome d ubiquinol oxidase subunit II
VPINSSGDFDGTFWDLFNAYTLLGGVAVVLLFAFHGATYLTLRTTGELCRRAAAAAGRLSIAAAVVGAAYLIWTVAVAVDRNDKDVFPPLLPALLAIVACSAPSSACGSRRSGWAFVLTAAGAFLVVPRSSRASTRASWSPAPTSPTASPSTRLLGRTTRSR